MNRLVFILFLALVSSLGYSQATYDWGDNKPEATGRYQYMTNCIKSKDYQKAHEPTSWLLANAPNLHVDLYKQAIKVFEQLEKVETDPARKIELQDSILNFYDIRINQFNDSEAKVLNRKGLVAYKYLAPRGGKNDELFALYAKIVALNGTSSYFTHAYIYMVLACQQKKAGNINDEQVLDIYDDCIEIVEVQTEAAIAKGKSTISLDKVKENIDKRLVSCVDIDCEFVQENFGPKLKENPTDLKIAKRIYSLLRSNKCISNDLYLSAAEVVLANEPSSKRFTEQGKVLDKMNRKSEAIEAFENAISLSSDNEEKGKLYLRIAKIYSNKGQKSKARSYARKCLGLGVLKSESHLLIGNLYMYSYDDCSSNDVIQSRSIYIAAYNEYKKAGETAKMAEAKKNFPSNEEIFLRGKKTGEEINTGCWINETVTLQTR